MTDWSSKSNAPNRVQAQGALAQLAADIRGCRACVEPGHANPLPHEPRPVLRVSSTARIAICGQAPGSRVHASGIPFSDPSGVRLRAWMGVSEPEFYDEARVAIVPMGFCFPGLDAHGADLPPRAECARLWRAPLFALLPQLELILLVGHYAQQWHLGPLSRKGMTETVKAWQARLAGRERPLFLALPHPSWRNNAWLKANPWFAADVLPVLRREVRRILT